MPAGRERIDTLAAIARVPRSGGRPADASLQRAIADDLCLGLDPLSADPSAPWRGPRPAALAAGAIGSRMTGGGFGGCVIALVPVDAVATVTDGVREAFASAGFTEPGIFTVRPVAGAGRIEVTP